MLHVAIKLGRTSIQDKTRQDIYFSDPQIKNIKYIQFVMHGSYCGGNEGSSITLDRLSSYEVKDAKYSFNIQHDVSRT